MSVLDEHLKQHRKKIIDREEKTFREMLAVYDDIEKELKKPFDDLQKKIEAAQANGETISPSWFYREKRLKNLLAQVQQQITRFGGEATKIIEREQREAIKIAVSQAQETYELLTDNAPDARSLGSTLNPRNVETAVGMMGDGSPILSYFEQQLAPMVAERIKSEIIKASATGTDFKRIAKNLTDAGGITKHRALSVARHETNRIRREATRQIYQENSDIIEGWEWVSSKSTRTCPLCLRMDGETFPLDEPFPQHINCRCSMICVIIGLLRRKRTLGKDWFESQPDDVKEKILGKETFAAYRNHNLSLDDFVAFRNDKRFGKSVTRKPLAKILADKKLEEEPPLQFAGFNQAKKWADKTFKQFESDLTQDEADSLANYGWNHYKSINPHLRGLELPERVPTKDVKEIEDNIFHIDAAIQKGKLPQPLTVFRGFGIESGEELKLNQILTDKAFYSVSLDKKVAKRFYGMAKEEGLKPVMLEIDLPKNLNAAYLENLSKMREVELLLERNSSFEILSIEEKRGVIYAKAKWKRRVGADR